MSEIRTSLRSQLRKVTGALALATSFFCAGGLLIRGQSLSDKLYTKEGVLLSKGTNRVPVGRLKVITYRLEQVLLTKPIIINRGHNLTVDNALRLTISLSTSINGAYTIWIDDQGFPAMPVSRNEITALIVGDYDIRNNATISLARGTACDIRDRSSLHDKLALPAKLAKSKSSIDNDGNFVRRIRYVTGAQSELIELELATSADFPVQNEGRILQIGDQNFEMNGRQPNANTLVFNLRPEQFAGLEDGSSITVKYGMCSFLGVRFGRLNKALIER
jgi:hypothetical protein